MKRQYFKALIILIGLLAVLIPQPSMAGEPGLAQQMQNDLDHSRAAVAQLQSQLAQGQSIATSLSRFQSLVEKIQATHIILTERFRKTEQHVAKLGPNALQRHLDMAARYKDKVEPFLKLAEAIKSEADVTASALEQLQKLLDALVSKNARPIYGALPYTQLNYAQQTPVTSPAITPAYQGGTQTVTDEDTQDTPIAPISKLIAEKAQSLNWDPAAIYEWVKNNVRTEWYWGCMKGAEQTLVQQSGNACDQAALLVALMRSAGYPARYVQGVIQFRPGLQTIENLTGCSTGLEVAALFRKAGIPYTAVLDGSDIINFQIAHIWVEAKVPYANYRGTLIDENGSIWLPLDTTIKNAGFAENTPVPVLDAFSLATIRDDYLSTDPTQTPLTYLESRIQSYLDVNMPGTQYADVLRIRTPNAETIKFLPPSLQFDSIAVTGEYADLADTMVHKVRFYASDSYATNLFDTTVEMFRLSNKPLVLTYEPETVEDQEIINSYMGLDNTPGYLVRLRPVLQLENQRIAVSTEGLASGEMFDIGMDLISPWGTVQTSNQHICGNLSVIGLAAQKAMLADTVAPEEIDAKRLLYEAAVHYTEEWQQSEEALAQLLRVTVTHPIPSLVTVGGSVEVEYLLGAPHGFEWKGLYVDADLRSAELVGGTVLADASDPAVRFMQLSALEGSALEGWVLQDDFQVTSISTARFFGLAQDNSLPLLTIDAANAAAIIPTLPFGSQVIDDISQAVGQGLVVTITNQELTSGNWTGVGYLKEDLTTGESGWMLTGIIAGGMTTLDPDQWPDNYKDTFKNAFSEPANPDPSAAVSLQKVASSDVQKGTVGQPPSSSFQVVALDIDGRPVRDVDVTFTFLAGGGTFNGGGSTVTVKTDFSGIARADAMLGQHTSSNPTLWWEDGYTYNMQVGENIINASIAGGKISLRVPFTAYAFPDAPAQLIKTNGDNDYGHILNWVGFVQAILQDQYGNPISNETVDFAVQSAVDISSCSNPNQDNRPAQLVDKGDACIDTAPTYGQCGSAGSSKQVVTSYTGAGVHVILGGLPEAQYPVTATAGAISTSFTITSWAFGNCSGNSIPGTQFNMSTIHDSDVYGRNVDAARPGDSIGLLSKISFLREGQQTQDYTFDCDGSPTTCSRLVGDRNYFVDTGFTSSSVQFASAAGAAQGNGVFEGQYQVAAGVNYVTVTAQATISHDVAHISCSGCSIDAQDYSDWNSGTMVVYGVEIAVPADIMVAVDGDGYATCDVPIAYTITPAEYTAYSAFVIIYRDGTPIQYIPTELHGQGSGILSRGFYFEENSTYEAEVVLNYGSDKVEIKSAKIPLNVGDIKIENITVKDNDKGDPKVPVTPGSTATVQAQTEPAGRTVTWSRITKQDGVLADIDSSSGIITAEEESKNGWIVVRATDSQNPCVYKDAAIFIGCPECAQNGTQCSLLPSRGIVNLSSIDVAINMGKAAGGQSAGNLFITADRPTPELATPGGLFVSSLSSEVEERYDEKKSIRQLMTPQAFIDIVTIDAYTYDILFYRPGDVSGEINGLYVVAQTATPYASWRIANPDASDTVYNRLSLTETTEGGTVRNFAYVWEDALNTWSLSKGNGLHVITRGQTVSGSDRTVTEIIKDDTDVIASTTATTYHTFPWGEEIIEKVIDPHGSAPQSTTYAFYDNPEEPGSYGRTSQVVNPDGSWVRYQYDDQGRKLVEISSWLDQPVGASAADARAVYYDYTPVDPSDAQAQIDQRRPRTVTEQIQGIIVRKTYYAYLINGSDERVEITEFAAAQDTAYGDVSNQRSVTTYYPSGTADPGSARTKSSQTPDGLLKLYSYEYGTYTPGATPDIPGTFAVGSGNDRRETVLNATVASPAGVAQKSTQQVSVFDALGNNLLNETYVYTGSGFERLDWTVQTFDSYGRIQNIYKANGTSSQTSWGCCGKESDTDAGGVQSSYTYDDLSRLESVTRHLANGDIVTSYTYDAAGRQLTQTTTGGALTIGSTNTYDIAGRLKTITGADQRTTTYDYSADQLTTTVTRPGGFTEITTRYMDGHTKSVTGTAVVPQYYTFGINSEGTRWTQVNTAAASSPVWELTVTDLLGRTKRTQKPGYASVETTEHYYDNAGHLVRTTTAGQADTLYVYDQLGNPILSGLDIDASGTLELNSTDRINGSDTRIVQLDGSWWQQSTRTVYATDNDNTATTVSVQRQRLTGLGGGLVAESITLDIHGNQTVSRTVLDPDTQTQTQTIDYPDSTIDAQTVTVGGLVVSNLSKTGLIFTYAYDGLGRRTSVTDPRTGTSTTHYDSLGQVDWIEDADGRRIEFAYDAVTGRKISQTDQLGKISRFAYNGCGQTTQSWGNVPYPVQYAYDTYGRMSALTTYRNAAGFDAVSFPVGATGDTTLWHYHVASGLLEAKEYADGSQVDYTYGPAGRLATRTWARDGLTTTYAYDPDTGELTGIDYSDGTPDIGFSYDRLGRQTQVTDAVGTRTFDYNNALQLETETITGLYSQTLTRTYDTSEVPGRPNGLSLASNYTVNYGFNAVTGRFSTVAWNIAGQSDTATYSYVPDSDLLQQVATIGGRITTYGYEPNRNLKTQVQNRFNSQVVSQYDYQYDQVGRRTSAANSGAAFAQAAFSAYGYNDRSELTGALRYLGTDIDDTSNPVTAEQRLYQYDPIGNRLQAQAATDITDYTTNALNQYTAVTGPTAGVLDYDPDGNLETTPDGRQYTYNAENRLIAAQPETPAEGDTRIEYTYDYMGRRIQKVVYDYSSSTWVQTKEVLFVYDGWNLIKETTIPDGASAVDKYYVWGSDLSQSVQGAGGIGGLLAVIDGSLTYQYLYDANGNVGQVIDGSNGTIAAHYEYDPYGNQVNQSGVYADENLYRFSTKYFDRETSLYYYGYRYYSAELGRWINRDPIEEESGLNLYGFVLNDGINLIDLFGLIGSKCVRLLIYTTSIKKSDENTFKAAAMHLKSEYKGKKDGSELILMKATSGQDIATAINKQEKDSIISLDIFSHSNIGGIHIANKLSTPIKSPWLTRKWHLILRKDQTKQDAEYMEESYHGLYSNSTAATWVGRYYNQQKGHGIAYLDDIQFDNFSNNSRVEFHGCLTAQEISFLGIFTIDNFALKFSKQLKGAGKSSAIVTGHMHKSSPDANNDYRNNDRRSY